MTKEEFRIIRQANGLTQAGLAKRLRIGDVRTIRRYEAGEREISGPVALLMERLGNL
jgi:transcriptional regulator with XRE-family HTH domain